MFVDASAMVAMLTNESDGLALAAKLEASTARHTSAVAVFETVAAVRAQAQFQCG